MHIYRLVADPARVQWMRVGNETWPFQRRVSGTNQRNSMTKRKYKTRRGAASVILTAILLLLVTATALTTMRGQALAQKANQTKQSTQRLNAALNAAESLPVDVLDVGLRLTMDETTDHAIVISRLRNDQGGMTLQGAEQIGDKTIQTVRRQLPIP